MGDLVLNLTGLLFVLGVVGLAVFLTYAGTVGTYRWLKRRGVPTALAVLLAGVALFTVAQVLALIFAIIYRSPTLANPGGRRARGTPPRPTRYFDAQGREVPPPADSQ